jgi:ferredoxin
MGRQLNVTVESTCISSGYCRNTLPDVFVEGPNRRSVVTHNPVEESPKLQEAMEGCPVEAISAVDAETGEVVFP